MLHSRQVQQFTVGKREDLSEEFEGKYRCAFPGLVGREGTEKLRTVISLDLPAQSMSELAANFQHRYRVIRCSETSNFT